MAIPRAAAEEFVGLFVEISHGDSFFGDTSSGKVLEITSWSGADWMLLDWGWGPSTWSTSLRFGDVSRVPRVPKAGVQGPRAASAPLGCDRPVVGDLRNRAYCTQMDVNKEAVWTREAMVAAGLVWIRRHGRPPKSVDWARAAPGRPTRIMVYREFKSWPLFLAALGALRSDPKWLSATQAGARLRLSAARVRQLARKGRIKHELTVTGEYRFTRAACDEYARSAEFPAAPKTRVDEWVISLRHREAPVSWAKIGAALDPPVSAQAAHQRYRHLDWSGRT